MTASPEQPELQAESLVGPTNNAHRSHHPLAHASLGGASVAVPRSGRSEALPGHPLSQDPDNQEMRRLVQGDDAALARLISRHNQTCNRALLDPRPNPLEALETDDASSELRNALTALPRELREAVLRFTCDDESQAQITASLGCSVKTVEMRLYHGRKQLRSWLETHSRRERLCSCLGVCHPNRNGNGTLTAARGDL